MTEVLEHVPHPGSRRDAVSAAEHHSAPAPAAPQEMPEVHFTVNTRSDMPEECIPRTMVLSATNPYLAILPRDMRRRRAVIVPIDNDVVLAESKELAQAVATSVTGGAAATTLSTGMYVPKSTVITLESRSWMFAAISTTASTSRVSVLVERYADPAAH